MKPDEIESVETVETAATEALANVAERAIEETAERTEQLVRAIGMLESVGRDMLELRETLRVHIEGNNTDFQEIRTRLGVVEIATAELTAALEEAEAETAEMHEEMQDAVEGVVMEGAASVEAAERTEPAPVSVPEEHHESEDTHRKRGRHFVRV